jgi:hypothetical protein
MSSSLTSATISQTGLRAEQAQIAKIVQEGFNRWNEFHQRFADRQNEIRQQDPGLAEWKDVEKFLVQYGNASVLSGYNAQKFRLTVLSIAERAYVCGNSGGSPVFGPDGQSVSQLGLNLGVVCNLLRRFGIAENPCGEKAVQKPAFVKEISSSLSDSAMVYN